MPLIHLFSFLPSPLGRTAVALVSLGLILGPVAAQQNAQPEGAPQGGAQPLPVPIGDGSTIKVSFPNSPIQAIIPFYTQLTGKKMILDSGLQGETLKIIAPKPLSKIRGDWPSKSEISKITMPIEAKSLMVCTSPRTGKCCARLRRNK